MSWTVSHKHKFIFIHIPKCGGQSLLQAKRQNAMLYPHLGNGDICPGGHRTLAGIMQDRRLNWEDVKDYWKFTIVRNPYDRMVTAWLWSIRWFGDMSFGEFVSRWDEAGKRVSHRWFDRGYWTMQSDFLRGINGEKVDTVYKLEKYTEAITDIFNKLRLPKPEVIAHIGPTRRKKKPWQEYYDVETKELVELIYKKDFDLLGYSKGVRKDG